MTGKKQDNEKDLQESFDRALESLINGSKRNDSDIQGPRRDIGPRPTPSSDELGPRRDIGPRPTPSDGADE